MSVFTEFFIFVKSGKVSDEKRLIPDFVILFLVLLAVRFAVITSKALLLGEDLSDYSEEQEKLTLSMALSYIVLIPLLEELVFRGFLGIPKNKISVFLIGLAAIFGSLLFIKESELIYPVLFVILLFGFAYLRIDSFQQKTNNFIKRYYHILVVISVLVFAGTHITNYDDYSIATFIALIPRVVSGFYLAYLVTKYSIWHSWLMHAINNTIPFIVLLIAG